MNGTIFVGVYALDILTSVSNCYALGSCSDYALMESDPELKFNCFYNKNYNWNPQHFQITYWFRI